jgi:hypothetical protein
VCIIKIPRSGPSFPPPVVQGGMEFSVLSTLKLWVTPPGQKSQVIRALYNSQMRLVGNRISVQATQVDAVTLRGVHSNTGETRIAPALRICLTIQNHWLSSAMSHSNYST